MGDLVEALSARLREEAEPGSLAILCLLAQVKQEGKVPRNRFAVGMLGSQAVKWNLRGWAVDYVGGRESGESRHGVRLPFQTVPRPATDGQRIVRLR